ncbi:helix-turn-helix transcriptional regulator [Streptomyces otsuchiensis]|uniref:helix-turn-helix transcriptional regulator n=1 Tax=Streptomyces otsuchiensis TaxID=2681388 RepID=UPI0010300B5A|nr:DNA-binding protein [Streptomyces otsuchiensis]
MTRPELTQREAAAACGVSVSTIRRRRTDGAFPGAHQDEARGWLIPVPDLLAAGLRLNAPAGPDPAAPPAGEDAAALRERLAEAERGRERAEVEAAHLRELVAAQREHLADSRRALLALTAGPTARVPEQADGQEVAEPTPAGAESAPAPAEESPRRRWRPWR